MADDFGDRLRRLRHDRGLSQEALAIKAGVSYRTIWRLENGDNLPSETTLARLREVLGGDTVTL